MVFKVFIFLVFGMLGTNAVSFYDLVNEQWTAFKLEHKKEYSSETEEQFRMKIFMENAHLIATHNQLYEQGLVTYKMKMNKWGDLLPTEFVHMVNGYNSTIDPAKLKEAVAFLPPNNINIPHTVDWREQGYVTPVKDQGECGSCWSFSATGSLEGQHFRKSGKLVSLSEQNLVDCSGNSGNLGCSGGSFVYAFQYIKRNGGIDTEASYPYEGIDDECRYNPTYAEMTVTGLTIIAQDSETELQQAVATVGPVSVAIDASYDSFQFYFSGVYYEPKCSTTLLDHAVLAVGYGTESGQEYWLVKNSWGTSWGDQGYIKMSRNRDNNCGIATQASYPLV